MAGRPGAPICRQESDREGLRTLSRRSKIHRPANPHRYSRSTFDRHFGRGFNTDLFKKQVRSHCPIGVTSRPIGVTFRPKTTCHSAGGRLFSPLAVAEKTGDFRVGSASRRGHFAPFFRAICRYTEHVCLKNSRCFEQKASTICAQVVRFRGRENEAGLFTTVHHRVSFVE